jgi:hypothetical protein
MRKKLIGISVCVMLVLTSCTMTLFLSNNSIVKANGGQQGGNVYPFDYIWAQAYNFSQVIREANYSQDHDIPRGREWATSGERYTIENILLRQMSDSNYCGLTGVHEIPIGYLNKWGRRLIQYSSKVILNDFNLTINNNSNTPYPYSKTVPKSEIFACPTGYKNWESPHTFDNDITWTMNNTILIPKNITEWWTNRGNEADEYKNVTCHMIINANAFDGNVTYLTANDPVPDNQDGEVYFLNDTVGCQTKINQITDAAGLLLITTGDTIQHADVSQCMFPVATIRNDATNLSQILIMLQGGSWMTVSEANESCLMFINSSAKPSWWPNQDFMIIDRMPTPSELYNTSTYWFSPLFKNKIRYPSYNSDYTIAIYKRTEFLRRHNLYISKHHLLTQSFCRGVIIYDSYDTHFMFPTTRDWFQTFNASKIWPDDPALPIFSINFSVGNWLLQNRNYVNVSGDLHQEFKKQFFNILHGVNSDDVVGYLDGLDNTKTMIISNRLDNWWNQGPGDSGIGGALFLGIAKYIHDNHIIPKINMTFLFTTGEEYNSRGNWYYLHSLTKREQDRVIGFFGLEQLGFAQKNTITSLYSNRDSTNITLNAIANLMNYQSREKNLGYPSPIIQYDTSGLGGSDADVWGEFKSKNFGKDVFSLGKDPDRKWIGYHRAGENYSLGDVLNITQDPQGNLYGINRSEVNLSLELAINITKYYCINPDCQFISITHHTTDSPTDTNLYNDSIQINYTINTTLPQDRVMVKTILFANNQLGHPLFFDRYRNITYHNYTLTPEGITDSITLTLNKSWPQGEYTLKVYLYNSTGIINNILYGLAQFDQGKYANKGYIVNDLFLSAPNDPPDTPEITQGPIGEVTRGEWVSFTTETTDPNGDQIEYQWDWRANKLIHEYSRWQGPYNSDVEHTISHKWTTGIDDIWVRVRARDKWRNPTTSSTSNWSEYWPVHLSAGCEINKPSYVLKGQSCQYSGNGYGGYSPYTNYTWIWDPGTLGEEQVYGQTIVHTISDETSHVLNLTVKDAAGDKYYNQISVAALNIKALASTNRSGAQPNSLIQFTNTSVSRSGTHINNVTWDFKDGTKSYISNPSHTFSQTKMYNVTLTARNNQGETNTNWIHVYIETKKPDIVYSTYSPDFILNGTPVTIYVDIFDNQSEVNQVKIHIITPDNTSGNYTMQNTTGYSIYPYEYTFTDTSQIGQYNYTIWVTDHANNTNSSSGYFFRISESSPTSGADDVSTKPYLTAHVDDLIEEDVNASFYQYYSNSYIINSENDWHTNAIFYNTTTDGNGNLRLNQSSVFGDGSDGDLWVNGTTTLLPNKKYRNVNISITGTLNVYGRTLKVSNTLNNYGTIKDTYSGDTGGTGGNGGSGGDASTYTPPNEGGYGGLISPGVGHGGSGGGGGGGGGAAIGVFIGADGGDGGNGGNGGKGGGSINIYACKLNNQGVIQVNGSRGDNGTNGSAGYHDDNQGNTSDVSGGGGGCGGGGNGGNGGYVNITYAWLFNQGRIFATGGQGGLKGTNGAGHDVHHGAVGVIQYGRLGGIHGGAGGHGGNGSKTEGVPSTPGYDGENGDPGTDDQLTPPLSMHKYNLTGYYTTIVDAGGTVEWAKATITQTTPTGTHTEITYADNSQGNKYYENISQVPACRYLKIRVNLSSYNYTITPSIDSIKLDTRKLLNTNTGVSPGANATYQWTGRQLSTTYNWQVRMFKNTKNAYGPVWDFTTITQRIFQINTVSETPHTIGLGYSVITNANITENDGGLSSVKVNVTYPDHTHGNYTMIYTTGNIYEYNFSSTWQTGQYNYTIWAQNDTGTKRSSTNHHFHVSANATISVCTIKQSYGENETIDLTDPPEGGEPGLPPPSEDSSVIARGLTWNIMQSQEGRYRYESSMEPVNYLENQVWKPINTNITRSEKPGYDYQVTTGLYQVYFKENPTEDNMVHVAYTQPDNLDLTASIDLQPYELLWRNQNNQVQRINMVQNVSGYPVAHIWPSEHEWHHNLDTMFYPNIFGYGTNLTLEYSNSRLNKKLWVNPRDLPAPYINNSGLTVCGKLKLMSSS